MYVYFAGSYISINCLIHSLYCTFKSFLPSTIGSKLCIIFLLQDILYYTRLFLSVKTNIARLGFGHILPSKNVGTTLSNFLYGVMNYLLMLCNYCFDNSGLNKIYILGLVHIQYKVFIPSRLKTWMSTSRNILWHLRFRIFSHLNNLNF